MPVELRSITLAPGERVEILVDFSDGRSVALETAPDANASLMMMGPLRRLQGFASDLFREGNQPLIRFEPRAGEGRAAVVPARLAPRERVDPARAVRRRRLVLNMGMGGMMGGGMGGARATARAADAERLSSGDDAQSPPELEPEKIGRAHV